MNKIILRAIPALNTVFAAVALAQGGANPNLGPVQIDLTTSAALTAISNAQNCYSGVVPAAGCMQAVPSDPAIMGSAFPFVGVTNKVTLMPLRLRDSSGSIITDFQCALADGTFVACSNPKVCFQYAYALVGSNAGNNTAQPYTSVALLAQRNGPFKQTYCPNYGISTPATQILYVNTPIVPGTPTVTPTLTPTITPTPTATPVSPTCASLDACPVAAPNMYFLWDTSGLSYYKMSGPPGQMDPTVSGTGNYATCTVPAHSGSIYVTCSPSGTTPSSQFPAQFQYCVSTGINYYQLKTSGTCTY